MGWVHVVHWPCLCHPFCLSHQAREAWISQIGAWLHISRDIMQQGWGRNPLSSWCPYTTSMKIYFIASSCTVDLQEGDTSPFSSTQSSNPLDHLFSLSQHLPHIDSFYSWCPPASPRRTSHLAQESRGVPPRSLSHFQLWPFCAIELELYKHNMYKYVITNSVGSVLLLINNQVWFWRIVKPHLQVVEYWQFVRGNPDWHSRLGYAKLDNLICTAHLLNK